MSKYPEINSKAPDNLEIRQRQGGLNRVVQGLNKPDQANLSHPPLPDMAPRANAWIKNCQEETRTKRTIKVTTSQIVTLTTTSRKQRIFNFIPHWDTQIFKSSISFTLGTRRESSTQRAARRGIGEYWNLCNIFDFQLYVSSLNLHWPLLANEEANLTAESGNKTISSQRRGEFGNKQLEVGIRPLVANEEANLAAERIKNRKSSL